MAVLQVPLLLCPSLRVGRPRLSSSRLHGDDHKSPLPGRQDARRRKAIPLMRDRPSVKSEGS